MLAAAERAVAAEGSEAYGGLLDALCTSETDASAIADVLWLLDAERACIQEAPSSGLAAVVRDLYARDVLSLSLLMERLDGPLLEAAGVVTSAAAFGRKVVRANTALVYRQQRYNLAREEPEGFAKAARLVGAVADGQAASEAFLELVGLIGYFDLDPVRTADIVLDALFALPVDDYGVWTPDATLAASRLVDLLAHMAHRPRTMDGVLGFRLKNLPSPNTAQADSRWAAAAAAIVHRGLATAPGVVAHLEVRPGLEAALAGIASVVSSLESRLAGEMALDVRPVAQTVLSALTDSHPLPYYVAAAIRLGDSADALSLLEMHPGASIHPAVSHAMAVVCSSPSGHNIYSRHARPSVFAYSPASFCALCESISESGGCAVDPAADSALPMVDGASSALLSDSSTVDVATLNTDHSAIEQDSADHDQTTRVVLFLLQALGAMHPATECANVLWKTVLSRIDFGRLSCLFQALSTADASFDPVLAAANGAVRSAARRMIRRLTRDSAATLGASLAALAHAAPAGLAALLTDQLVAYESMAAPIASLLGHMGGLPRAALLWTALGVFAAREGDRSRPDGQPASWLSALSVFFGAFALRCADDTEADLLAALLRIAIARISMAVADPDGLTDASSAPMADSDTPMGAQPSPSDVVVMREILSAVTDVLPNGDPSDAQRDAHAGGLVLRQCVAAVSSAAHARTPPSALSVRRRQFSIRSSFLLRVLVSERLVVSLFVALSTRPAAIVRLGAFSAASGDSSGHSVRTLRGLVDDCRLTMQQLLSVIVLHGDVSELRADFPLPSALVSVFGCSVCDASALWRILDPGVLQSSDAPLVPGEAALGRLLWGHGLPDVVFPSARYMSEAVRLRTLLAGSLADASADRSAVEESLATLEDEMHARSEHVQKTRGALSQALLRVCPSAAGDACTHLYVSRALSRILHSPADAQYAAVFVQLACAAVETTGDVQKAIAPSGEDEEGALPTPPVMALLGFVFDALPGLLLAATDLEAQYLGFFLGAVFGPGSLQATCASFATTVLLERLEQCLWPCGPRTRPALILLTHAMRALPATATAAQGLADCLAVFVRALPEVGEDVRLLAARYLTLLHQAHPTWTSLDAVAAREVPMAVSQRTEAGDESLVGDGKRHEAPEEGEAAPVAKRMRSQSQTATTDSSNIDGVPAGPSKAARKADRLASKKERVLDRPRRQAPHVADRPSAHRPDAQPVQTDVSRETGARDLEAFRRAIEAQRSDSRKRPPFGRSTAMGDSSRDADDKSNQPVVSAPTPVREDPTSDLVEHEARLRRSLLSRKSPGDSSGPDRPPSLGSSGASRPAPVPGQSDREFRHGPAESRPLPVVRESTRHGISEDRVPPRYTVSPPRASPRDMRGGNGNAPSRPLPAPSGSARDSRSGESGSGEWSQTNRGHGGNRAARDDMASRESRDYRGDSDSRNYREYRGDGPNRDGRDYRGADERPPNQRPPMRDGRSMRHPSRPRHYDR